MQQLHKQLAIYIKQRSTECLKKKQKKQAARYPYSMMVIPTSVHTIGMNFLMYEVHTKKYDHALSKVVVIPLV